MNTTEKRVLTTQKAIEGCRRQDRISQKYIFDRWADAMLMLCMRYVSSLPDAEELMLNGFFAFYRAIDRFVYAGDASISAWLKKIMVNECLMYLRKKGHLKFVEEKHGEGVAEQAGALDKIAGDELFRMVLQLPEGYRAVFNLHVVEGFTHAEVAVMLGISEGTSKSQLAKAKAMLRKRIYKETGIGDL